MNERHAEAPHVTVPVVEEELHVGREQVETGRALRLRKQVDEVPAVVDEPLVRDVLETRRVPVGRVLDAPVGIRHEGDTTIVPVIEERLVTRKELVLVEEIHIRRRAEVTRQREQVMLRRERVVIERLDPGTQKWLLDEES